MLSNHNPSQATKPLQAKSLSTTSQSKTLSATEGESLECTFAQYVRAIEQVDFELDDDPLDPFYRCVQWGVQNFPQPQEQSERLFPLTEETYELFLEDTRYQSDTRYLKICTLYGKLLTLVPGRGLDAAQRVFEHMAELGIGRVLSVYYEEYATLLEHAGMISQARQVYDRGLAQNARPIERLRRRYQEFNARHPTMMGTAEMGHKVPTETSSVASRRPETASTNLPHKDRPSQAVEYKKPKREERLAVDQTLFYRDQGEVSLEEVRASQSRYQYVKVSPSIRAKESSAQTLPKQLQQLSVVSEPATHFSTPKQYTVNLRDESDDETVPLAGALRKRLATSPTINTKVAEAEMIEIWNQPLKHDDGSDDDFGVMGGVDNCPLPERETGAAPPPLLTPRAPNSQPNDENFMPSNVPSSIRANIRPFMVYPDSSDSSSDESIGPAFPLPSQPAPNNDHRIMATPKIPVFCDTPAQTNPSLTRGAASAKPQRNYMLTPHPQLPTTSAAPPQTLPANVRRPLGTPASVLRPKSLFPEATPFAMDHDHDPTPLKHKKSTFAIFRDEVVDLKPDGAAKNGPSHSGNISPVLPDLIAPTGDTTQHSQVTFTGQGILDQTMSTIAPLRTNDSMYTFQTTLSDHEGALEAPAATPYKPSISPSRGERLERTTPSALKHIGDVTPWTAVIKQLVDMVKGTPGYNDISGQDCNQSGKIEKLCQKRRQRGGKGNAMGLSGAALTKTRFQYDQDDLSMNTELLGQTLGMIDLGPDQYTVESKLGEGGDAVVYLVTDLQAVEAIEWNSFDQAAPEAGNVGAAHHGIYRAMKIELQGTPWEFYILCQAHQRLERRPQASVVAATAYYGFRDESYLLTPYYEHGTLVDAVNAWRQDPLASHTPSGSSIEGGLLMRPTMDTGVDEMLALFYMVELLRTVQALHHHGIVHTDLKPDNVLLRFDNSPDSSGRGGQSQPFAPPQDKRITPFKMLHTPGFGHRWSTQYSPEGHDGWAEKGICLIDFGRALDLRLFPDGIRDQSELETFRQQTHSHFHLPGDSSVENQAVRPLVEPTRPFTQEPPHHSKPPLHPIYASGTTHHIGSNTSRQSNRPRSRSRSRSRSRLANRPTDQAYSSWDLYHRIQRMLPEPYKIAQYSHASCLYSLDYLGLANVAHTLLHGKYLEKLQLSPAEGTYAGTHGHSSLQESSRTDNSPSLVMPSTPLKRYWQVDLWVDVFRFLLNPHTVGSLWLDSSRNGPSASRPPRMLSPTELCHCLALLRGRLEQYLVTESHKTSKNLKSLLKQMHLRVHDGLKKAQT
ncbi:protein kinase [Dispira parvispora]|uniref:Protein kinase n=1 Tax=Dispira parvispora TaxID=1520584 RepID=A0A9W8E9E2_9FUNG|nr:protein kinase [Dispira parvispora]